MAPPRRRSPSPDPPYRPVRLLRQGDCPASAAESGGMRICQPGRAGADGHTGKPASGPGAGLAGPRPCPGRPPSPIGSRTVWDVQYPGDDSPGGPLFSAGNHSCQSGFGQNLRRSHRRLPSCHSHHRLRRTLHPRGPGAFPALWDNSCGCRHRITVLLHYIGAVLYVRPVGTGGDRWR